MTYANRFRGLDLDDIQPPAPPPQDPPLRDLRDAVRRHKRRRAMQEAINRSGVCRERTGKICFCPNCKEYHAFWSAVHRTRGEVASQSEARLKVGRAMTDGAASTPWQDVGLRLFIRRLPSESNGLDGPIPDDYFEGSPTPEY